MVYLYYAAHITCSYLKQVLCNGGVIVAICSIILFAWGCTACKRDVIKSDTDDTDEETDDTDFFDDLEPPASKHTRVQGEEQRQRRQGLSPN